MIRSKADEGHTARLTAGFCWRWSDPDADGTLVPDVKVGAWQMPWNAKPDAGRLAAGIPPGTLLGLRPERHQPGRLRLHRPGLRVRLRRRHLRPRPALGSRLTATGSATPSQSHDSIVKRSGDRFTDLVKRTYRVLLTRGMKGCYVYFEDEATRSES